MTPEMRFRWLWARLMGGPMFPAKPLKWGGTIHPNPQASRSVRMVLTPHADGISERLAWYIPGEQDDEIITNLIKAGPSVFSLGE